MTMRDNKFWRGIAFLLVGSLIYVGHGLHSGGAGPAIPSLVNTAHAGGVFVKHAEVTDTIYTVGEDGKTLYKWRTPPDRQFPECEGWVIADEVNENKSQPGFHPIHSALEERDFRKARESEAEAKARQERNRAAEKIPGLGSAGQNKIDGVIEPRAGEAPGATAPGSKPFPTPGKPQRNQLPNGVSPKGKATAGGPSPSTK